MQQNEKKICNNYIKLKNPIYYSDDDKIFIGSSDSYDFKTLTKKFDMLKETLKPFDIYFQTIYAGSSEKETSFVVDTNSHVVWHKRKNNSRSASNFLYIGINKIKLLTWLKISHEERTVFINSPDKFLKID